MLKKSKLNVRFPKARSFMYHIMEKYNIRRIQLGKIMNVTDSTATNYLCGTFLPKKDAIAKLAKFCNEKIEVFESLCYNGDHSESSAGKAAFPNVRAEIIKNCQSKACNIEIATTNGIHEYEYFLASYCHHIIEDVKRIDTQEEIEILDKEQCLNSLKFLEKNEKQRSKMFINIGKWYATNEGGFLFENAPRNIPPLRFFYNFNDALKFSDENLRLKSNQERILIQNFRNLSKTEKNSLIKISDQKVFYEKFSETTNQDNP